MFKIDKLFNLGELILPFLMGIMSTGNFEALERIFDGVDNLKPILEKQVVYLDVTIAEKLGMLDTKLYG